MTQLPETDRSSRARAIFREAGAAGITNESIGKFMFCAAMARRRGDAKAEIKALRSALDVHERFGTRHAYFAMPTFADGTHAQATRRLAELERAA